MNSFEGESGLSELRRCFMAPLPLLLEEPPPLPPRVLRENVIDPALETLRRFEVVVAGDDEVDVIEVEDKDGTMAAPPKDELNEEGEDERTEEAEADENED
ncbi:hypothetical protein BGZ83_005141 [Gryganskiella cystojenkinii]|nr:hypothetical protein BGZ83_005141 [Gryganskiella cystojenkinii]